MLWIMTIGTPWRYCRQAKSRCDLRPNRDTQVPESVALLPYHTAQHYSK